MKFFLKILLLFVIVDCTRSQNSLSFDYPKLIQELEQGITAGNLRDLRDLGSLLDKKGTDRAARAALGKTTFFTMEEMDISTVSKKEFLSFYYDNEQKLVYSELFKGFYITPLENRKVDFKMRPTATEAPERSADIRRYFKEIDAFLDLQNYKETNNALLQTASIRNVDDQLLFQLLQDHRLFDAPEAIRKNIYQNILTQLIEYQEVELAEIIIQMWEGGFIDKEFAVPFMTRFTNCKQTGKGEELAFYQHLIDSLGDLDDIRRHGYESIFNFKLSFFHYPVDYYGKILGLSGKYPWILENALLDLKRTQHPRALFYIATQIYSSGLSSDNQVFDHSLKLLTSLINVDIGILNKDGKHTFSPPIKDKIALFNYLLYWAANHNDYEWDENRNIFINKLESLAKTQNYEKLFRRLNSRNDSVAFQSFLQLTQGDPVEINALARKYRQLLRNHNPALPSMKYRYLEQLNLLTDFCKKNNFVYEADNKLKKLLNKLYEAETLSERYAIENRLIKILTVENVTVLEYWSCLYEKNKAFAFSAGRILDWFYSKNWDQVINDNDQLRFYLKKSYLFESIGVSGVCNAYLNKFDPADKHQYEQLRQLEKLESDEDIINQITLLLSVLEEQQTFGYGLDAFLEDPLEFKRRDIKILPAPAKEDFIQFIEKIKSTESTEEIKKFFSYLRLHPDLDFVPGLFGLIYDERVVLKRNELIITVGDHIIPIVEQVYAYNFPRSLKDPYSTGQWKALWERDSVNYMNWAGTFYVQKLDSLKFETEIGIDDLNLLIDSPHFNQDHKPLILQHLNKVKPLKNIRKLDISPKLNVEEDLIYFQNFFLSYKELDDIPKLFEIDLSNAAIILKYLEEKSANFNFSEKGSFYNNLFQSPWLNLYLGSKDADLALATNIKTALEAYLEESDFLSEYEEQASIMHIAQIEHMGKNLEEQLLSTLGMDAEPATKMKIIDEIIAGISYEEIHIVLNNFNLINTQIGDAFCAFLHKDFGLPIFNIRSQKYLDELISNHIQMTEYEFYLYYLEDFGVDFLGKTGELDYYKIFNILKYDIISPFVGERGGKRDDYSYGIIKLLELKFDTRLGFHEKLNESQTFYSYTSTNRAQAWIRFFRENHLIDTEISTPPSFNQVRKEL